MQPLNLARARRSAARHSTQMYSSQPARYCASYESSSSSSSDGPSPSSASAPRRCHSVARASRAARRRPRHLHLRLRRLVVVSQQGLPHITTLARLTMHGRRRHSGRPADAHRSRARPDLRCAARQRRKGKGGGAHICIMLFCKSARRGSLDGHAGDAKVLPKKLDRRSWPAG